MAVDVQPHDRFNFSLRASKRIERKMVVEVLGCIHRYDSPKRFAYIGMGSVSFADFVLFHRTFGIDDMYSIEWAETDDEQARFTFNRPFACIKMVFGSTYEKLAGLPVFDRRPVICWLDYYDRLNAKIIGDLRTFLTRAQVGSAFLVTLNVSPFSSHRSNPDNSRETFLSDLPPELRAESNEDLRLLSSGARGAAQYMLDLMTEACDSILLDLNAGSGSPRKMRQIVNIFYRDAAPMVTLGWLLLDEVRHKALEADPAALTAAGFNPTRESTEVIAPPLTFREIQHLRGLLPVIADHAAFERDAKPVPADFARRFAKLYRYFPSFADVEE